MALRLHFVGILASTLVSGLAHAQAAPAPDAPASPPVDTAPSAPAPAPAATPVAPAASEQTIFVAQPPLPPLEPRSRRFHDGFYLRLSVGAGYLHVTSSSDNPSSSASSNGGGMALDVLVGGTPAPGLVLGGGLLLQEAFSPKYGDRSGTSGPLGFAMIGPMIDVFPNPTGGFHVGALAGLSRVGLKDQNGDPKAGFGLSAWLGYMWWASSDWSVGGLVKGSAGWSSRTVDAGGTPLDVSDATRSITFMLSTAFH